MRSIHARTTACAVLLMALCACSQRSQEQASAEGGVTASAPAPANMAAADAGAGAASPVIAGDAGDVETAARVDAAQVASSAATHTDARRKFIRTAQAEFRVEDVYRSALAIEDIAAAHGGFVTKNAIAAETQNVRRRPIGGGRLVELAEYVVRGSLTARVPSEKTQTFLLAIVGEMEFLDRRNFEAEDAQFALLRQQLAFQRNEEAQRDIGDATRQGGKLDQKTGALQARAAAQAGRDEALVAQKEFEDRVAFSTIQLSLYQLPKIRRTETMDVEAAFQAHGPGFFLRLGDALRAGWYGALEAAIALASLWPLWLLLMLAVFGYRWLRGRRRAVPK